MSWLRRAGVVVAVFGLASPAWAQDYRFPTSIAHWDHFYPTAYKDHSGVDWSCGDVRYDGHAGSDFGGGGFAGMDEGRDIVAAADGVVSQVVDGEFDRCGDTQTCTSGGYGNQVRILHADGKTTLYGHLKQWSVAVEVGEEVVCGQLLAQMGSSGHSTGPHVHFEVRAESGVAQDPFWGDCSSAPSYWNKQWYYAPKIPLPICEGAMPPCEPAALLTCGDIARGNTGGEGSTQTHVAYGCGQSAYTGPEIAWRFIVDRDGPVTVDVTGLSTDVDLFVLTSPACEINAETCVDRSHELEQADEHLVFDATAGFEYVILLDGWKGVRSDFELSIQCSGQLPTPDEGPEDVTDPSPVASDVADEDTQAQGSDVGSDLEGSSVEPAATGPIRARGETQGCACSTLFHPSPTPLPLLPRMMLVFGFLVFSLRKL